MSLDAPDTAHSPLVDDHVYIRDVTHHHGFLCAFQKHMGKPCNLAESTHGRTMEPYNPKPPYRCPDCVTAGVDPCPHPQGEWLEKYDAKQKEKAKEKEDA